MWIHDWGFCMQRRLLTLAAGGAAALLARPALAQSAPTIRWRMTSSFPKSLDLIYATGELFCRYVGELTDGRFRIQQAAAGEIVPALQAMDAVSGGGVEMAHTFAGYYIGKDVALQAAGSMPFLLNARQQHAWLQHGGGNDMVNGLLAPYNIRAVPLGNTGNQMGGWFRKELRSLADLTGLKMRISGIAGTIVSRLGAVPQQLAAGDIYPALERGTIDAVEFLGPYDDARLGFNKVAPFYYFPGWGEGGAVFHAFVNEARWRELPPAYRNAIEVAAAAASPWMLSSYDYRSPAALRRLVAEGAQLRAFPPEIINAAFQATRELIAETSAANPRFKAIVESQTEFRDQSIAYMQVAELPFDNTVLRLLRSTR